MRIWSILLIQSDLKWCIHLSRSLFFIFVGCVVALCRRYDVKAEERDWLVRHVLSGGGIFVYM